MTYKIAAGNRGNFVGNPADTRTTVHVKRWDLYCKMETVVID